jgi:hypothetical protein
VLLLVVLMWSMAVCVVLLGAQRCSSLPRILPSPAGRFQRSWQKAAGTCVTVAQFEAASLLSSRFRDVSGMGCCVCQPA